MAYHAIGLVAGLSIHTVRAKKIVSAEVQTCCGELLQKSQGGLAAHRWDCCANLPADAGQEVGIACTPWGPPVPPRMQRRSLALAMQVLA